ncbi:MAG: anthrax toxin-like adenylyl cyclase domain-containing protein, partial [Bacteroidota bacterium]
EAELGLDSPDSEEEHSLAVPRTRRPGTLQLPPTFAPQISVTSDDGSTTSPMHALDTDSPSKNRRLSSLVTHSQSRSSLVGSDAESPSKTPPKSRRHSVMADALTPRHSSAGLAPAEGRRRSSIAPLSGEMKSGFISQYVDAVDKVSRLRDEVIMVRDPNARSAAFLQAGFSSKPLNMKGKTDRQTGLIPRNQKLSKAAEGGPATLESCQKSIEDGLSKGIYTARTVADIFKSASPKIRKLLETTPLKDVKESDPNREYICDRNGRPVTADYDLLGIGKRKSEVEEDGADRPVSKSDLGFTTPSAIGTIIDLNVQVKGDGYAGGLLFHHGAEDRNEKFTQAQGKSVLFDPTKRGAETITATDDNMKYFNGKLAELDKKGYDVYRNKNWGSAKAHRLKSKVMDGFNALAGAYGFKEITISDFDALDPMQIYKQIAPLELEGPEIELRQRLYHNLCQLDPAISKLPMTTFKRTSSRGPSPYAPSPQVPSSKSLRKQDLIQRLEREINAFAAKYSDLPTVDAPVLSTVTSIVNC